MRAGCQSVQDAVDSPPFLAQSATPYRPLFSSKSESHTLEASVSIHPNMRRAIRASSNQAPSTDFVLRYHDAQIVTFPEYRRYRSHAWYCGGRLVVHSLTIRCEHEQPAYEMALCTVRHSAASPSNLKNIGHLLFKAAFEHANIARQVVAVKNPRSPFIGMHTTYIC